MTQRENLTIESWGAGNCMTYRRKMRSRSWVNRKGHDLKEKNEIQVMEEQGKP